MGDLVYFTKPIKGYNKKAIMNPNHERWEEFAWKLLLRYEDCDIDPEITRTVLQEMGGIDVDGTLELFASEGYFCQCEVLLNIVARSMPLSMQLCFLACAMGMTKETGKHSPATLACKLRETLGGFSPDASGCVQ